MSDFDSITTASVTTLSFDGRWEDIDEVRITHDGRTYEVVERVGGLSLQVVGDD